jgi:hypothetical protein
LDSSYFQAFGVGSTATQPIAPTGRHHTPGVPITVTAPRTLHRTGPLPDRSRTRPDSVHIVDYVFGHTIQVVTAVDMQPRSATTKLQH